MPQDFHLLVDTVELGVGAEVVQREEVQEERARDRLGVVVVGREKVVDVFRVGSGRCS